MVEEMVKEKFSSVQKAGKGTRLELGIYLILFGVYAISVLIYLHII